MLASPEAATETFQVPVAPLSCQAGLRHAHPDTLSQRAGFTPSSEDLCVQAPSSSSRHRRDWAGVGLLATIVVRTSLQQREARSGRRARAALGLRRGLCRPGCLRGEAGPLGKLVSIQTRGAPSNILKTSSNRTNLTSSGEDCCRKQRFWQVRPTQHRSWGSMLRPQGGAVHAAGPG